ncbi:hypothetical protein [Paraburkholderia acidisoli]|uniref:hypothetical protein n=1 Tax=Paraburkholderia acidisoli TaxID=2571748 RepID=UPI00131E77D9|nr:hypothetical protein [Paraburkholderia acidisoli]
MTIPVTVIGGRDDELEPRPTDPATPAPARGPALPPTAVSQHAAMPAPDSHAHPTAALAVSRLGAEATTQTEQEPEAHTEPPPLPGNTPIAVTAIGGAFNAARTATIKAIAHRFPNATPALRARVRALLVGHGPAAGGANTWLTYGVAGQTAVNATIKAQIALLDASAKRDAPTLLARLYSILEEVGGALEGGLFRRSARAVWSQHEPEMRHIETRLGAHANALLQTLDALDELDGRYAAAHDELEAFFLAGTYTFDTLPPAGDDAQWLHARLTALTASQQLAQQNRLMLVQQRNELRELVTLLQDGVLVKLPAVAAQLAMLPDKPNETERYLARDALGELAQLFERTRKWHSS